MSFIDPTGLSEYVRARQQKDLPTHVVVEQGGRSSPEDATAAAEGVAAVITANAGEIVRGEVDDLGADDVVIFEIETRRGTSESDWQQYRELAAVTRASSYGGLVAIIPEADATTEVYSVSDVVVRVDGDGIEGVYWPRVDGLGNDVYLVALDAEVIDA